MRDVIGVSMRGRHQSFHNTEGIIKDFGYRGQAVRGATGIGHNTMFRLQPVIIHTDHNRVVDLIFGGHGQNNPLGTGFEMVFKLCLFPENTGGLNDDVYIQVLPGKFGCI